MKKQPEKKPAKSGHELLEKMGQLIEEQPEASAPPAQEPPGEKPTSPNRNRALMTYIAFLFGVAFVLVLLIVSTLCMTACGNPSDEDSQEALQMQQSDSETTPETVTQQPEAANMETGVIAEQILSGNEGDIHYNYYLPENYDENKAYPLMMTMPGYDRMWFGEDSSGSNLEWSGFRVWTELPEDMIVVSAQLTDWHETSARQAVELTEYFIQNFSVDKSRVYAAGYSAGGETMSKAVAMRPDLYAAYLHGASQWDGTYDPIAENGVAVYIFMAENDEYYGSGKARETYDGLREAYETAGWSAEQIDEILIIFQRILLYITKKYIMLISSATITWKNGILKTGV